MLNNNHNSSCVFAEQIVSYLYGEVNDNEKAAFDVHLFKCSSCTDELAEFGLVRSSIDEWKHQSVDVLETPFINIPYPVTVSTEKQFRLGALRQLFSFSPTWATAFAALILCIVAAFFAFNFITVNDVARNEGKPINTVVSPIDDKKVERQSDEMAKQNIDQSKSITPIVEDSSPKIAPRTTSEGQIVKISNNNKKVKNVVHNNNNMANVRKLKNDGTTIAGQKRTVPKTNNLEEEDDSSLRLADLFAEVESK